MSIAAVPMLKFKIDLANPKPPGAVQSFNLNNYDAINCCFTIYDKGEYIHWGSNYQVSASVTINNLLVDDNIAGVIDPEEGNDIIFCLDKKNLNLFPGVMAIQISIKNVGDTADVFTPPHPVYVRVTADISESAEISPESIGNLKNAIDRIENIEQNEDNKLDNENNVIGTNHIQNGAVAAEKLAQSVLNTINGKADKTDKVFKAAHMGVLMPALRGGFPDFSTSDKTLTLRQGTQLMLEGIESSEQVKELAPNGDTTIYCNSISSSAIKIYYNLQDEEFNVLEYNGVPTANDILICAIRDVSRYSSPDNGISISCAYTIDGKLFGVNLADYIANNSITEAQLSTAYKQAVQNSINALSVSFQNVVNGLNTNINAVKKLSLTNLIKGATFAFGSVANSTGAETVADNRICSGFINVADAQVLECSITSGYKYAITCYDSQKAFAAGTAGGLYWVSLNYQTAERTIPLHPAVKYIRVTISDSSDSTNITLDDSNKIKVLADYSQYRRFHFLNNYQGKLQESIIPHDVWSNGVTDGSTFASDSTRIFSGLIELPKSGTIKISTTAGYKANYVVFDENMTRIKAVGYDTLNSVEIGNNYKWLVIAVKIESDSNVDISPNEGINCTISYIPNVQLDDYAKDISVINSCVKSIAHRGLSDSAPENTLEAYRAARKAGFIYAETDVAFTNDDVPVLLHDSSINRTARNADGSALSSTINIVDITYAQSQNYDFGIWKGAAFAGTKIPKFEDFIKLCRNIGMKPCIELKPNATTTAQVQNLVEIVRSCGMLTNVIWTSFEPALLAAVKTEDETACLGMNVDGAVTSGYVSLVQSLQNGKNQVIMLGSASATSTEINLCKSANIPFEVGVCDTIAAITALDPYISGIWSNKLHAGKVLYENSMT